MIKINSILFYFYRIISRCYFHLPILFFYFWNIQLGMYISILLLATYGISSTFSSGINLFLTKYISVKYIVLIGEFLKISGLILLLVGSIRGAINLNILFLSQIVGGIGFAIAISNDASLLRFIVDEDQNKFIYLQTKSQSGIFIATLVSGTIGSILFDYNMLWPFYVSILFGIIAMLCIYLIKANGKINFNSSTNNEIENFKIQDIQRFWMLFYSISRAFSLAPFIGFIPFYFIMVNVDPMIFGLVLSCFTLSAWFSIKISAQIIQNYSINVMLIFTVCTMLSAFLFLAHSHFLATSGIDYFIVGLISLVLLGFGSGAVRPSTMANLDLTLNSPKERVVIFSTMERDFGILNGLLLLLGAWLLVENGFEFLMMSFCFLYFVIILISFFIFKFK